MNDVFNLKNEWFSSMNIKNGVKVNNISIN